MLQAGFYGRSYAEYQGGKKVVRSTFQSVFPSMQTSFHNYVLNIRQKLSEDIFATKYMKEFGREVRYGWQLVRYVKLTGYKEELLGYLEKCFEAISFELD